MRAWHVRIRIRPVSTSFQEVRSMKTIAGQAFWPMRSREESSGNKWNGCSGHRNQDNRRWLLAGFSQQESTQAIVGLVPEHALDGAAQLMRESFFPQPEAAAGVTKVIEGEVTPHGYPRQFVRAGVGGVGH